MKKIRIASGRGAVWIAAACAVLVTAACGSTTGSGSADSAASPAASSAPSSGPASSAMPSSASSPSSASNAGGAIKVALPMPFTGPDAAFGAYAENAFKVALDQYASKLSGQTVSLIKADTKCTPSVAVQAINQIRGDSPLVATSSACSGDNLAMKPVVESEQLPMVVDSLSPNIVDGAQTMWQVTSTVEPIGAALAKYMAQHSVKSLSVIHDASSYGEAAATGIVDGSKAQNIKVADNLTYQLADTDYSAQILAAKKSSADAVYVEGYALQAANLIKQAKQLGLAVPIYASLDIDDPAAFSAGGSALNGVVFASSWIANDSAASQEFVKEYKAVAGSDPGVVPETVYESAVAILEAIIGAGSNPTRQTINDALAKVSVQLPSGPAEFDSNRVRKGANIYIGEVENNAVKLIGTL